MPGQLNHKELQDIARTFGSSPKAADRLSGAVRVRRGEKDWLLGLNLYDSSYFMGVTRADLLQDIAGLLGQYRKSCPKVVTWLCGGGFNPHKIPESINTGELLHAARTASRLRAEALRARQQTAL